MLHLNVMLRLEVLIYALEMCIRHTKNAIKCTTTRTHVSILSHLSAHKESVDKEESAN